MAVFTPLGRPENHDAIRPASSAICVTTGASAAPISSIAFPHATFDFAAAPAVTTVAAIPRLNALLDPDQQITVMHDFSCVSHREKACRDEFGKGLELRPRVIVLSGESQR
jgi:hypothetical protein